MSPSLLLISFFLFTLASMSAALYIFILKPAAAAGDAGASTIPSALNEPDLPMAQAAVLQGFASLGAALPPAIARREAARRALLLAGFRWPSAVSTFLGIKCATAFTLGLTGAWASVTFGNGDNTAIAALSGIGFGFLLPDRVLGRIAHSRGARMRRALPAALDLMVLAIEAGQGLDSAIMETSRGLRTTHPELAGEFRQLSLELRAEASRIDALRNFAARTADSEIRKFTVLLMDTDRFGSSLGPALRTHAHFLRTRFRQMAQERARKVGVKLIFPVFFLIFPSVILVTLGPAVIMIFSQMSSLMGM
ncbi:MAG: type II secretion system F family protein [Acidobacteriota bacterium]